MFQCKYILYVYRHTDAEGDHANVACDLWQFQLLSITRHSYSSSSANVATDSAARTHRRCSQTRTPHAFHQTIAISAFVGHVYSPARGSGTFSTNKRLLF